MNITIEVIPHESQRYPTAGDWYYDDKGNLIIRVSDMNSWKHEALIAVHELVEVLLCKNNGVSQQSVDKFDTEFEMHRHPDNDDEPGDHPDAPYVKEHCFATAVERMMAAAMGVTWSDYDKAISKLP